MILMRVSLKSKGGMRESARTNHFAQLLSHPLAFYCQHGGWEINGLLPGE